MKLTSEKAKIMGKTSSRKGVPNKTTKEIRDIFQTILENNIDRIQEDIEELDPISRLRVLIEISKFILPTLKATDLRFSENETITIDFKD